MLVLLEVQVRHLHTVLHARSRHEYADGTHFLTWNKNEWKTYLVSLPCSDCEKGRISTLNPSQLPEAVKITIFFALKWHESYYGRMSINAHTHTHTHTHTHVYMLELSLPSKVANKNKHVSGETASICAFTKDIRDTFLLICQSGLHRSKLISENDSGLL